MSSPRYSGVPSILWTCLYAPVNQEPKLRLRVFVRANQGTSGGVTRGARGGVRLSLLEASFFSEKDPFSAAVGLKNAHFCWTLPGGGGGIFGGLKET